MLWNEITKRLEAVGRESWEMKEEDLAKLEKNYMLMVWWMCNMTLKDRNSSDEF